MVDCGSRIIPSAHFPTPSRYFRLNGGRHSRAFRCPRADFRVAPTGPGNWLHAGSVAHWLASCMRTCVRASWRADGRELIQEERRGEASRRKAASQETGCGKTVGGEAHPRRSADDSQASVDEAVGQANVGQTASVKRTSAKRAAAKGTSAKRASAKRSSVKRPRGKSAARRASRPSAAVRKATKRRAPAARRPSARRSAAWSPARLRPLRARCPGAPTRSMRSSCSRPITGEWKTC